MTKRKSGRSLRHSSFVIRHSSFCPLLRNRCRLARALLRFAPMSRTAEATPPVSTSAQTAETHLRAYRWMLLARVLEEKIASLYRGGKITGGVFLGKGQEALSASIGTSLR